jgi:hypothetical protein
LSLLDYIFLEKTRHGVHYFSSFGKALAHVRICLLMKKAHGTNRIVEVSKNIDGFYTKTTQKRGFSKLILYVLQVLY